MDAPALVTVRHGDPAQRGLTCEMRVVVCAGPGHVHSPAVGPVVGTTGGETIWTRLPVLAVPDAYWSVISISFAQPVAKLPAPPLFASIIPAASLLIMLLPERNSISVACITT